MANAKHRVKNVLSYNVRVASRIKKQYWFKNDSENIFEDSWI